MRNLDDINGIGPALAREMTKSGIGSIEELVAMRPGFAPQLARNVDGVSLRQLVEDFRPQAKFLLLPGLTGDVAAALVDAGFRTYRAVLFADPAALLQSLPRKPAGLATTAEVMTLQIACAKAQYHDTVLLCLTDAETGKPVTGARLAMRDSSHAGWSTADVSRADARGWIVSPACARGRTHRLLIDAPGYRRTTVSIAAAGGAVLKRHIGMMKGTARPEADEFAGQSLGVIPAGAFVTWEEWAPAAVPPGSIWRLQSKTQTGQATLECLMRRRYGSEIRVFTTKAPLATLPAPAVVGGTVEALGNGAWGKPGRGVAAALRRRRGNSGRRQG